MLIEIYKPGTKVLFGNVEAFITCASIRGGGIQYELSYLNNGEYKNAWVSEFEFNVINGDKKSKVGFK